MSRPWVLVPSLVALRAEFDQLRPHRDRRSDGTIGDQAHADRSSDHNPDETGRTPFDDADDLNEVHALDVDADLDPDRPDLMERVVSDVLLPRLRAGAETRLQNIIYNRRIWSRSSGWVQKPYSGASPHTGHAHFSARYTTAQEIDTRPYGLATLEAEMDRDEFLGHFRAALQQPDIRREIAEAVVLTDNVVTLDWPNGDRDAGVQSLIRWPGGHAEDARDMAVAAAERATQAAAIAGRVEAKLDALIEALPPGPAPPATNTTPKAQ